MLKSLRTLCASVLFFAIVASIPAQLLAQVVFSIGQPNIDSFPVVRTGVYVTNNGAPAQLVIAQKFYVAEDGIQVGAFGLTGCGGTSDVAMAIVLDTSASMDASISTGGLSNRSYAAFYESFSRFLASIPGPSEIALVPFADSSLYSYPGPTKNYFYSSASTNDTSQFVLRLRNLTMDGKGTAVDDGILNGARVLANSTLPSRVMILVTDDAIKNAFGLQAILKSAGITLFVMEVARDSINVNFANRDLAIATGGTYYAAYDTSQYTPSMIAIAQRIFSEHCTLRYVSNLPCPWYQTHSVRIDVTYKGSKQSDTGTYSLGATTHDTIPPHLTLDSLNLLTRVVSFTDPFPCASGMKSLTDSGLVNLKKTSSKLTSGLAVDSLVVQDSMYPADGYFTGTDSAGNITRTRVHYAPKPDTRAPQFGQPVWNGNGNLTLDIAENLAWDRGLQAIIPLGVMNNLILDSIVYTNHHFARAYFHLIKIQGSAGGCLTALDSAGNLDTLCIDWTGDTSDIFPPTFVQDPNASPYLTMTGEVFETRLFDRGIKSIIVTPLVNTFAAAQSYVSVHKAMVSVGISDSLYPASAMVEAYDSIGHYMRDTMWYTPQDDTQPPILTYVNTTATTFDFSASDSRAWDHGIKSLTLLPGAINAVAAVPIYTDAHNATIRVTVSDKTQNASMTVEVTDSVGHVVDVTATYQGVIIVPLGTSVVDFGTVTAPSLPTFTRTIDITNPNTFPVSLALTPLAGDASEFRIVTASPVAFAPHETQTLTFEFDPALLGSWTATTTFMRDTLQMGSITLLAKTTGQYSLALDTANVAQKETAGVLHLSIDADPKPINLDSIPFSLQYDQDVITVGDFALCPTGSLDTGVCLYNASWVGGVEGNRQGLLMRNNLSQVTTLSFGRSVLSIPFVTYLAKDSSTVVHLTAGNSNLVNAAQTYDGLVTVGSTCGDLHIRYFLQGKFLLHIDGIAPNPSSGSLNMRLHSEQETDAQVRIISVLGTVVKDIPVHIQSGDQLLPLTDLPSTTGPYEIVVRVAGIDCSRQRFELLR